MYVGFIHTPTHIFQEDGDFMKVKNIALVGLGAGAVLAYQKYNKPVMKKMEEAADKVVKKANNKLEDMMQFKFLF